MVAWLLKNIHTAHQLFDSTSSFTENSDAYLKDFFTLIVLAVGYQIPHGLPVQYRDFDFMSMTKVYFNL